jgi:hypothetical protein
MDETTEIAETQIDEIDEIDEILSGFVLETKVEKEVKTEVEVEPEPVIKVRRLPGRPKTKPRVLYVDDEEMQPVAVIRRPVPIRQPSARELREMETHERFVKMEQTAGKRLAMRRNGEADKRSLQARTPAQLEATRKLVAAGKARREASNAAKHGVQVEQNKSAIREAVQSLQAPSRPVAAPAPKLKTREEYMQSLLYG